NWRENEDGGWKMEDGAEEFEGRIEVEEGRRSMGDGEVACGVRVARSTRWARSVQARWTRWARSVQGMGRPPGLVWGGRESVGAHRVNGRSPRCGDERVGARCAPPGRLVWGILTLYELFYRGDFWILGGWGGTAVV